MRLESAGKTREISWRCHLRRVLLGIVLNQKHQILRIARYLLLILLAILLLPYLLAPLYRAGHPVSTLMAWRRLTGHPVSRQWID